MAEGIAGLFSAAPGLERVNPVGLIVLVIGAIAAFAGGAFFKREEDKGKALLVRLGGLAVAIAGALIAMY